MKIFKHISLIILIFLGIGSFAQPTFTGRAYEQYKGKNFDGARELIDSAITTNERFDSQTWQLRGIIYRNLETADLSYFREISIESFVQAKNVDSTNIYTEKINEYIQQTIIRYYNDAVRLMNENKQLKRSEESYELYKDQYKRLLDPKHDFKQFDIDYYNALGAEYLALIKTVPTVKQDEVRKNALEKCDKVISIDSLNYQANYNAAIIQYNYGAELITDADPTGGLERLMESLQKAEEQFLKALPYAHRAEKIKPNSFELLICLMSCYYGLNNSELYMKYQTKFDELTINDLEESFQINPNDLEVAEDLLRIYTTSIPNETKAAEFQIIVKKLKDNQ